MNNYKGQGGAQMRLTERIGEILLITLCVIVICLLLICAGLTIYAFAKYGNTPIAEVPTWAIWFMFGGGRK